MRQLLELDGDATARDFNGHGAQLYSIGGRVAIPCLPSGKFGFEPIGRGNPILDVPIEIDNREIGHYCLSSKIEGAGITASSATDVQKIALIKLTRAEDFDTNGLSSMRAAMDCVVILEDEIESFLRYRATSAAWGGFVLEADATPLEKSVELASTAKIEIRALGAPRTQRHKAALQRATESSISVDRFLHLYHFLELDYDHEIVERIRAVNLENTSGLEKLLNTGRTELDRLHLIAEDYQEIDRIEEACGSLKNFGDVPLLVFYDYGKDSNPLKDREAFIHQFIEPPTVSRAALNAIKSERGLSVDFGKTEASYTKTIVRLACYWIYRIRCCIAHNKLGEYHLTTPEDMKFVSGFGEPLVRLLIAHRLARIA